MRKFTKMMLTLALLFGAVGGVSSVKAEKLQSDFSEITTQNQATWDADTHTMGWSTSWANALAYFMIKGVNQVDGYYDLSTWETITITISNITTSTTNGVRIRMKDNTGGDGDWILMGEGAKTYTFNITDFKKGGNALDYSKIAGIQLSGGSDTKGASTATFSEIYLERPEDATIIPRANLTETINLAKKQHSFGKTEASFAALTTQITAAEAVRDNASATADELSAARTALQNKIDALQLLSGYSYLTVDMHNTWAVQDDGFVVTGATGGRTLQLFTELNSGDVVYGTWSGDWQNFAELSNYSRLYATGTPGEHIRGYFNKSPEGTGTVDITLTFDEDGIAYFDFVDNVQFSSANNIHLIFLKASGSNSGVTSLLLYDKKHELKSTLEIANLQNPFAKTEESFSNLESAISVANDVVNTRTATDESITEAKTNIENAIKGLKLVDGYTNLTAAMYKTWDSATEPTTGTNPGEGCAYNLNQSTGQPYGDGSVKWYHYADISEFSALHLLTTEGTPRIMMNRAYAETGDGGDYVQITDAPIDGKVTVDLTAYPYAHLNAIKSNGWGTNVTITEMLLYRTITVGSTGCATFGSLDKSVKLNGVKGYAAVLDCISMTLTLTEVTNVPAGRGVIIKAEEGEYAPTFDVEAEDIVSDLLVSNGTVKGDGNIFALANGTQGVGFYKVANGEAVPAGKAYLNIAAEAREFIGFGGEATGIKMVENAAANNGEVFNLAGQRVAQPTKGLYIMNGKKVVIK